MKQHFTLDPDVTFLNHGAFGACPKPVQEIAAGFQAQLEREPVRFFVKELAPLLDRARAEAAAFVGCQPEDLAFIHNSTSGVNTVLRSLDFGPSDGILITDHGYNACNNAARYVTERTGAELVVANVPFPLRDPGEVVESILRVATPNVKLAVIDHVTSQTGLVLPIEEIVRRLRERGIETLVDGAHAPGMVDLDVTRVGAAYYVGNFHKWVCAPKGAAMLWVRPDLQAQVHPLVISHGFNSGGPRSRFLSEFDWTGSDDPSAWLSVPAAIRFLGGLFPGGWAELRSRNRALCLTARSLLQATLGVPAPAPDSMIGTLAALPLPDGDGPAPLSPDDEPLHVRLFEHYGIEVPVFTFPKHPSRLIRISAQVYNLEADYARLAAALKAELH